MSDSLDYTAFTHQGACSTEGCSNSGHIFQVPSIDGVVQVVICGVCGVDFRENCVPI